MEECELVTHGHRHGDCLPGSVGGVSYGNGARSSTQGRQCVQTDVQTTRDGLTSGAWSTVEGRSLVDSMEECELVTHGHRHGDCLPGSVGGVSYGNGARSSTQGRQ